MKTILIITALNKEKKAVEAFLNNLTTSQLAFLQVTIGEYHNDKIILIEAGIGKVNAAISTTLAIKEYHPDYVINSGIAGGYQLGINTLDIVIAKQLVAYDVDMTADNEGFAYGQIQDMPLCFPVNEEAFKLYKKLIKEEKYENVHYGTIATGDQFVTNYQKMDDLVKQYFPTLDIVAFDMESASVAQTCYRFNIPVIVIRTISDCLASPNNYFDYQAFSEKAATTSAEVIKLLI